MALAANRNVADAVAATAQQSEGLRTRGPEIEGKITFNTENYRAKLLSPREIQGDELPSEWLLQSRRAWGEIAGTSWWRTVLSILLTFTPILVWLLLVVLERWAPNWTLISWAIFCLDRVQGFLAKPLVSAMMGILGLLVSIRVIVVIWSFVGNGIFGKSRSEKQIWIGGGTTTLGVGEKGLSIKTIHSIFAVDWSAIESYRVLLRSQYGKYWPFKLENAFHLKLRHYGTGKETCHDVLLIPERFFDGESALKWNEFEELLKANIARGLG